MKRKVFEFISELLGTFAFALFVLVMILSSQNDLSIECYRWVINMHYMIVALVLGSWGAIKCSE